jgi:hypothetical protein
MSDFAHTLGAITPEYAEAAGRTYPCCPHCAEAISDHVEHGGTVERDQHDLPCSICEHQKYVQPLIDSAIAATRQAAADTVLAAARRICCGDNPGLNHSARAEHARVMGIADRLARAVRDA